MNDTEILNLILDDPALTEIAKRGDDTAMAKELTGRIGHSASNRQINSSDILQLFGWTRGGEILSGLRAKEGPAMEVARALDRWGLNSSDPSAEDFWQSVDASEDEKQQLIGLGLIARQITQDDVSRIMAPKRPNGKLEPDLVVKSLEAVEERIG